MPEVSIARTESEIEAQIEAIANAPAVKLNIGSGDVQIPGYRNVDRKFGEEAFPLREADESVDEIYASHILEHFGTKEVPDVLKDWFRVLKPGGIIRVAVPNFRWIADAYHNRVPADLTGFLMGGQFGADDFHRSMFDEDGLRLALLDAGFVGLDRFSAFAEDSSRLPVSLNIQATKPAAKTPMLEKSCVAVMSMGRLTFTANSRDVIASMHALKIPLHIYEGVFWGQCLSRAFKEACDRSIPWVLTIDHDTLFTYETVRRLWALLHCNPTVDALTGLQARRGSDELLIRPPDDAVNLMGVMGNDVVNVRHMHFGLTFIRTEALKRTPKPWLIPQPDEHGDWGANRIDEDVGFWHKFTEAGNRACVAPRVPLGHMQLMATWVGRQLQPVYQYMGNYYEFGRPKEALST